MKKSSKYLWIAGTMAFSGCLMVGPTLISQDTAAYAIKHWGPWDGTNAKSFVAKGGNTGGSKSTKTGSSGESRFLASKSGGSATGTGGESPATSGTSTPRRSSGSTSTLARNCYRTIAYLDKKDLTTTITKKGKRTKTVSNDRVISYASEFSLTGSEPHKCFYLATNQCSKILSKYLNPKAGKTSDDYTKRLQTCLKNNWPTGGRVGL